MVLVFLYMVKSLIRPIDPLFLWYSVNDQRTSILLVLQTAGGGGGVPDSTDETIMSCTGLSRGCGIRPRFTAPRQDLHITWTLFYSNNSCFKPMQQNLQFLQESWIKPYIHSPTRLRHISIHRGTNTTSHDQLMKSSNLSARNMNWSIFTAQNSSNCNKKVFF